MKKTIQKLQVWSLYYRQEIVYFKIGYSPQSNNFYSDLIKSFDSNCPLA